MRSLKPVCFKSLMRGVVDIPDRFRMRVAQQASGAQASGWPKDHMGGKIKVWHAARKACQTPGPISARTFGLTDSGTGGTADGSTNRTAHNSTSDGSGGGLLFDGRATGGGTDSDGGKGECQGKAFHHVSSSNMVKPERQVRAWVPTKSELSKASASQTYATRLKTLFAESF